MKMECKTTLKKGRVRRLHVECADCKYGGSLGDPTCFERTMDMLKTYQVKGIQYNKKDFSESYSEREVDLLVELMEVVSRMEEEKIWENLECKLEEEEKRYTEFLKNILKEFHSHPAKAYDMLRGVIKQYEMKLENKSRLSFQYRFRSYQNTLYRRGVKSYMSILKEIRDRVDECKLIKAHKRGDLQELFTPIVQPVFISSHIDMKIPENSELIDKYRILDSDIRIFESNRKKIYFMDPPELWLYPHQVSLLTELNRFITQQYSMEIIDPKDARNYFRRIGSKNLANISNGISKEESQKLIEIFTRYSAGYGLLEILFKDRSIYDIYVDSPPGSSPVYINHEEYGTCITNIYLTEDDMEKLSSKFRAISERPFDEANPLLDMNIEELGIRVAGVAEPATFDGLAYAFRKHREDPWTLAKFVQKGMFSSRAAALLSFLIAGQRCMLITGARGSGKTSLLSALVTEIDQRDRIILMEDTAEIPTNSLREMGWKIEHLKNQPPISRKQGYELSPEENLRAALRLGESVLILGEVRGSEARALFEAMRIGAAGNAVLGTIHGSSPYDTWDRITNDLRVPPTSFKAIDIIVSLRYIEKSKDKRMRRVMQITEVGNKWTRNPDEEGAFFDLMTYNERTEREEFNLSESKTIKDICMRKGLSEHEFKELLDTRERIIDDLLRDSRAFEDLLEVRHVAKVNREYQMLTEREHVHRIYSVWRGWFDNYLRDLMEDMEEIHGS